VLAEYAPATDYEVYQVRDRSRQAIASSPTAPGSGSTFARPPAASRSNRYYYSRPRPRMIPGQGNAPAARGASHSAEIEIRHGQPGRQQGVRMDPRRIARFRRSCRSTFANFIKTGDPNGAGLPKWAAMKEGSVQFMHIDVESRAEAEAHRGRNLLLDRIASKQ